MHDPGYASGVTWTGSEIRRRRLLKGLNQRQLADAVGVSPATIRSWEATEDPRPRREIYTQRLREALHLPGDPDPNPPTSRGPIIWTGAEVRRRRELLGLQQDQLAEAVGVHRRTVTNWETGGQPPSGRHLARLQEVLRLPEEEGDHQIGPLLADADFSQVLLRMVELHNRQRAEDGLPPLLDLSGVHPPADLPEHDHVEGPDTSVAGEAGNQPTGHDNSHSR